MKGLNPGRPGKGRGGIPLGGVWPGAFMFGNWGIGKPSFGTGKLSFGKIGKSFS